MVTINAKRGQNETQALFEELEARFGANVAQQIITQVELTASGSKTPDYMVVKAVSEMLELFRGEAQDLLSQLRNGQDKWDGEGSKVSFLEKRKLELEFRHIYRLYWVSMKLFYPLYNRAMADHRTKIATYGRLSETSSMAMAA